MGQVYLCSTILHHSDLPTARDLDRSMVFRVEDPAVVAYYSYGPDPSTAFYGPEKGL